MTCYMFIPAFQKGEGGAERKKNGKKKKEEKYLEWGLTNTAPPKSRSQHVTCNVSQRHVVHGPPSRRTNPTPVLFTATASSLPRRAETCPPRGGAHSLCPTPRKDSPHAALLVLLFRFPLFPPPSLIVAADLDARTLLALGRVAQRAVGAGPLVVCG